jgi:hypothetical protein
MFPFPSLCDRAVGRDDELLRLVRDRLADERRNPSRKPDRLALGVVQAVAVAVSSAIGCLDRQPLDEPNLLGQKPRQLLVIDPVPHRASFFCDPS